MNNNIETDYSKSFNEYVYNAIPANSVCLDVGCSTGNLGRKLITDKRCKVDGIDLSSRALEIAKTVGYQKTYNLDLNYFNAAQLDTKKYDVIIFADVLEHTISPETILHQIELLLKENGKIIISIPNVAFVLNRIKLLLGHWDYKEYGTLDRTHLRFYTKGSSVNLVKSCGYEIEKFIPYFQFGIPQRFQGIIKLFPSLLAYQFLIIAVVKK